LHNPHNLEGMREAMKFFPGVPHVAVFDTAFHQTLPTYAYLYGLPYEWYKKEGIRRYGFHGTSHRYVSLKAAEVLKRPLGELEIISCHLGVGASMCAIDHGRSVDTTMGMTPSDGLIMPSRSGSLDPAIMIQLMDRYQAGSGRTQQADQFGKRAQGHFRNFQRHPRDRSRRRRGPPPRVAGAQGLSATRSARTSAPMSRRWAVPASWPSPVTSARPVPAVRSLACQGLAYMGIKLDEDKNSSLGAVSDYAVISADDSPVTIIVVANNDERLLAWEALRAIERNQITLAIRDEAASPIPIEVSAHHVHLAQADVEKLFGPGHQLTPEHELSQPGQFACAEKVDLVGPKGRIANVRVLGPTRKETQVEIAMTEQFKLGVQPPIRESGDLANTPGIRLEGPAGSAQLERGVICAQRHIHMSPEDAMRLRLRDRYVVRVRIEGEREVTYGDVVVRVNPNYRLAMHIDTDEGNAGNITTGMQGFIEEIQSRA
jgi:acetate kinase